MIRKKEEEMKIKQDRLSKCFYAKLSNRAILEYTDPINGYFCYFIPGLLNNRIDENFHLAEPLDDELHRAMKMLKRKVIIITKKGG